MIVLTDPNELDAACRRLAQAKYVTVDTEFIRDKTYWPRLCLIQVAGPADEIIIDPLADGMDLAPLYGLLADESVLKVFHAARQDVEIFYHFGGVIPDPLFDTQVAAMVCGFGDAVSYERLVRKITHKQVDKSSRFTDWSRRPLTERQLRYAIQDVTYLRSVYEWLSDKLKETGRSHWLEEEMAILTSPSTYQLHPELAWKRLKSRSTNRRYLGVLKEVAAWREKVAQERDLPRNRIVRDEGLLEIAGHPPSSRDDLAKLRHVPKGFAESRLAQGLIDAAQRGNSIAKSDLPDPLVDESLPPGLGPVVELLKVLLKMRCEEADVAQKLVANVSDLERIAADSNADVPALRGWRRQLFGDDAVALKAGRLALSVEGRRIRTIPLAQTTAGPSERNRAR